MVGATVGVPPHVTPIKLLRRVFTLGYIYTQKYRVKMCIHLYE